MPKSISDVKPIKTERYTTECLRVTCMNLWDRSRRRLNLKILRHAQNNSRCAMTTVCISLMQAKAPCHLSMAGAQTFLSPLSDNSFSRQGAYYVTGMTATISNFNASQSISMVNYIYLLNCKCNDSAHHRNHSCFTNI